VSCWKPDITSLSSLPPETRLLAAGFPCIDVSRAGLGRGISGRGGAYSVWTWHLLLWLKVMCRTSVQHPGLTKQALTNQILLWAGLGTCAINKIVLRSVDNLAVCCTAGAVLPCGDLAQIWVVSLHSSTTSTVR
jgi:hypothetical protein